MDNEDPQQAEIQRLRNEVEAYRQKELADLRQRVLDAEAARDHYRSEAQRNADTGRQIAAELSKQVHELQVKIDVYEQSKIGAGRPTR